MQVDPIANPPARSQRTRRSTGDRVRMAVLSLANGIGEVQHHSEKAWASITFAGTRHTLRLIFEGDTAVAAGEDLVAALPDHEFTIPRQLVADANVTGVESTLLPEPRTLVECELLLLEDA